MTSLIQDIKAMEEGGFSSEEISNFKKSNPPPEVAPQIEERKHTQSFLILLKTVGNCINSK